MNPDSPYATPATTDPVAPRPPVMAMPQMRPTVVTVLGILHIVFSSFGFLKGLWALVAPAVTRGLLANNPLGAELAKDLSKMETLMMAEGLMGMVVAAILLTAGIKLLKRRRDAVAWSNRYAYTSISWRIISAVFKITVVMPSLAATHQSPIALPIQIVITILTVLVLMIYSVLSLILLNRRDIKEWFATAPA